MILLKPHTLTRKVASPTVVAGNVAIGVDHDLTEQTVRGQLTPLTGQTLYESFGVEFNRPHLLLADVSELEYFTLNDRWTMGSREFRVAVEPQIWNAETATSCIAVGMEELDLVG